jgi:hypothetical protein
MIHNISRFEIERAKIFAEVLLNLCGIFGSAPRPDQSHGAAIAQRGKARKDRGGLQISKNRENGNSAGQNQIKKIQLWQQTTTNRSSKR